MKKGIALFILTVLFVPWSRFNAQTNNPDTVFIKRDLGEKELLIDTLYLPGGRSFAPVLVGTTFLPYSEKMIGLLNNGLSPISLEIVDGCDNSLTKNDFKDYPVFREIRRDSSVLTIEVSVIANCCDYFLGEAEVIGEDTLNLIYTTYGAFCSCSCCFTLRYKLDTSMESYYQILQHVTINGSDTIGQIPNEKEEE